MVSRWHVRRSGEVHMTSLCRCCYCQLVCPMFHMGLTCAACDLVVVHVMMSYRLCLPLLPGAVGLVSLRSSP